MGKVFDEWKSGFTYDKADESPFAIFVGYDEYVDAIAADLQRHKDALGRVGEQVVDMKAYGPPYALAGDNIANMFDNEGCYIWPIEGDNENSDGT